MLVSLVIHLQSWEPISFLAWGCHVCHGKQNVLFCYRILVQYISVNAYEAQVKPEQLRSFMFFLVLPRIGDRCTSPVELSSAILYQVFVHGSHSPLATTAMPTVCVVIFF